MRLPATGSPSMTSAAALCEALLPGVRINPFGHLGDGNINYNLSPPPGVPDFAGTEARLALRLARLATDPVERKMYLLRVVSLEPGNARARSELARLGPSLAGERRAPRRARPRWHVGVLALAVLVAFLALAAALVWGPVDSSLARLLPTATPAPTPTPTRTPGEVAAQFYPQLDAALAAENWGRALEIVAIVQGLPERTPIRLL